VGKKGNPNWGKPYDEIPSTPSSFEQVVRRLRLSEKDYESSAALKDWVQKHKDSKFVPVDLLERWGFSAKF
jgi:hypothetical protein